MTDSEPTFDRAEAEGILGAGCVPPDLDAPFFRRLLAYARRTDWGRAGRTARQADQPAPQVTRYFAEFLTAKLNRQLLPDLKRLTATFKIILRESPDTHWSMDIRAGVLTAVSANGIATQCSFTLDAPTFFEIVAGRLPPPQAFFDRRVDIEGDVEVGLRLAAVLTQFFRKFPFTAEGR